MKEYKVSGHIEITHPNFGSYGKMHFRVCIEKWYTSESIDSWTLVSQKSSDSVFYDECIKYLKETPEEELIRMAKDSVIHYIAKKNKTTSKDIKKADLDALASKINISFKMKI